MNTEIVTCNDCLRVVRVRQTLNVYGRETMKALFYGELKTEGSILLLYLRTLWTQIVTVTEVSQGVSRGVLLTPTSSEGILLEKTGYM